MLLVNLKLGVYDTEGVIETLKILRFLKRNLPITNNYITQIQ